MALARSAATFGGITMISRVTGYVRDVLCAAFLGAGPLSDAFFLAMRLPSFFNHILTEGAFNSAFIPLFSSALARDGKDAAHRLAQTIFNWITFILIIFVVVMIVFMPQALDVIAPGFKATPEHYDRVVTLARIMFPFTAFTIFVAFMGCILNVFDKFAAVAFTPILMNILMSAGIFLGYYVFQDVVHALAISYTLAGFMQFLMMLYLLRRLGFSLTLRLPHHDPIIKKFFFLLLPTTIGVGAVQINSLVNTWFASYMDGGALSYLFYADRLTLFPLGVIGVALSTVLLPTLTRALAQHDAHTTQDAQNRAIELGMFLTVPSAVALFILAHPIVSVLFERGAFTPSDALQTSHALQAMIIGLPAYVLIKILTVRFFADKNTKTPLKIALLCVGTNIVFNIIFRKHLQYVGIALSLSLCAWLNVTLLLWKLSSKKCL